MDTYAVAPLKKQVVKREREARTGKTADHITLLACARVSKNGEEMKKEKGKSKGSSNNKDNKTKVKKKKEEKEISKEKKSTKGQVQK